MRTKPSPKHAMRLYKQWTTGWDQQKLDLDQSFLDLACNAARRAFEISIVFTDKFAENDMGMYSSTGVISLKPDMPSLDTFAVLCHELVHHYCHREKIFWAYHDSPTSHDHSHYYAAELWVENVGEQLFHKFFPSQEYSRSYWPKGVEP